MIRETLWDQLCFRGQVLSCTGRPLESSSVLTSFTHMQFMYRHRQISLTKICAWTTKMQLLSCLDENYMRFVTSALRHQLVAIETRLRWRHSATAAVLSRCEHIADSNPQTIPDAYTCFYRFIYSTHQALSLTLKKRSARPHGQAPKTINWKTDGLILESQIYRR